MKNQEILDVLNYLADKGISCTIRKASFGYARLFRYEHLINSMETEGYFHKFPEKCYVFEIGKNNGDVFSANLVKSIELIDGHADIILKG